MSTLDDDDPQPDDEFWGQLDEAASEPADWAGDDLEAAYLRAMEAVEAFDAQYSEMPEPAASNSDDPPPVNDVPPTTPNEGVGTVEVAQSASADRLSPTELTEELAQLSNEAGRRQTPASQPSTTIGPRQILEALLFVGGEPLSIRKLNSLLRGEFSPEFIEAQLDALNSLYTSQGRPYQIRLGEGGYRMTLRDDFERIRRRAYGLGPKEVKLSQEAIEVLAVIAYHQPVTTAAIEELGKPGCRAIVGQLLRRELIAVERQQEVTYRTTPRFLSLFGIRNLNELPRLEQVAYK